MPITLKNLAERANVSIGTVSRALSNDPLIAVKTREKIQRLARELNYVPNHFGRGLRAQKSRLVGYLVGSINDSFNHELLQGISQELTDRGYSLVVGMTGESVVNEQRHLALFREKSVDGIIISNYSQKSIATLKEMANDGLPMVVCDTESFAPHVPHIKIDDRQAMRLLTQHLYDQGHSRFAYGYPVNAHSMERYQFHNQVAISLGCPPCLLCTDETTLANALKSDNPPTAVICYSDHIAIKTKHLIESQGFSIPQDVALTGFDDLAFSAWPEISLTTIAQPRSDLGRLAAERLFELMDGKTVTEHIVVPPTLMVRGSTKKP